MCSFRTTATVQTNQISITRKQIWLSKISRTQVHLVQSVPSIFIFSFKVAIILYGKHPWTGSPALDEHMHDSHMNEEEEHGDDGEHSQMAMGEHMDGEHINTMFAVLFFAWHIAAAIAIISGISFAIYKLVPRNSRLEYMSSEIRICLGTWKRGVL